MMSSRQTKRAAVTRMTKAASPRANQRRHPNRRRAAGGLSDGAWIIGSAVRVRLRQVVLDVVGDAVLQPGEGRGEAGLAQAVDAGLGVVLVPLADGGRHGGVVDRGRLAGGGEDG